MVADADYIEPPVTIRRARPGERMRPLGMTGSKKIFDMLAEAGIPATLREQSPVLADRRGVFWVIGAQQAQRTRVRRETQLIQYVKITRL